jgi:hypothetical protein
MTDQVGLPLTADQQFSLRTTALQTAVAAQIGGEDLFVTASKMLSFLLTATPIPFVAPSANAVAEKPAAPKAPRAPKPAAAATPTATAAQTATPAAAPSAPTTSPAPAVATPTTIPPPVTVIEVAGEFRKLVLADRTGAIKMLKEEFGVEQLAQVPPPRLAELMAKTKAMLAKPAAPVDPLAGLGV